MSKTRHFTLVRFASNHFFFFYFFFDNRQEDLGSVECREPKLPRRNPNPAASTHRHHGPHTAPDWPHI